MQVLRPPDGRGLCRAIRRERDHGRGRYRDSASRVGLTGCGKAGLYWPAGPVAAGYDHRYSWIRPPFERKPGMDIGVLCKKRLYGSKKMLTFQKKSVKILDTVLGGI